MTGPTHSAGDDNTIMQVCNISLSFQGIKAITDLSFDVRRREICALIGPNGAGKSSLLNVVNGVYTPDTGEIRYGNESFRRLTPLDAARRGIGRTFQNNALFKKMSVLDNIMAGLSRHSRTNFFEHALRLPRATREETDFRRRSESVLEFLDLSAHRHTPVGSLPYGVQKRVELGRALVSDPVLLLLDEPMAGMNAQEKAEMAAFIKDINRHLGVTVVLIEHDVSIIMNLSDHVVVLDYGRKVGDGTPSEVRANPEVIAAYLGAAH